MASINDVKKAVKIFKNKCKFTLLHCVSTYPCKDENLNLLGINQLKKIFKCDVGCSGYEDLFHHRL